MAEIKEMTIPLRAAWSVPRTRRANRAMAEIKIHVARHTVSYTHLTLPTKA